MKYYYKDKELDKMSNKKLIKLVKKLMDNDHMAIETNFDAKTKRLLEIF